MEAGKKYVDEKNYEAALTQFTKALAINPAARGAVFNMAYCLLRLERLEEALGKFEAYIGMNPGKTKAAKARLFVEQITTELGKTRQMLTVNSSPGGAEVYLDGKRAGDSPETPTSLWLAPGQHRLEVKLVGYEPVVKTVVAEAGARSTENFVLVKAKDGGTTVVVGKPPAGKKPSYGGSAALVALGGATLAGGIVLYAVGYGKAGDPDSTDDEYNQGRSLAIAGDICMGVGGAATLAGIIWMGATAAKRKKLAQPTAFGIFPVRDGVVGSVGFSF
jgi:tetratricopeptide (TPR) repeat protein